MILLVALLNPGDAFVGSPGVAIHGLSTREVSVPLIDCNKSIFHPSHRRSMELHAEQPSGVPKSFTALVGTVAMCTAFALATPAVAKDKSLLLPSTLVSQTTDGTTRETLMKSLKAPGCF